MQHLSVSHCSNSDTLKDPRQYRLTMRAHRKSSMTPSSNAAPKPWTCVFIGSRTASPKTNTSSIGAMAATTSLTTSPSIIPRLTNASCAHGIWSTYTDQLLCKGVLNLPRNHLKGYTQISTTDKPYCLALISTNDLTRLQGLRPSANASCSSFLWSFQYLPIS